MYGARRAWWSGWSARFPIPSSSHTDCLACLTRFCIGCISASGISGRTTTASPTIPSRSRSTNTGSNRPEPAYGDAIMSEEHSHSHTHTHDGKPIQEDPLPSLDAQVLEASVRELLIEKGIVSADEIRRAIEQMETRGEALGARKIGRHN